ncbi:MAG TPA: exodeoxyribonuclease III, partial [Stellaceae bacterium]|nr:exodeoxyribonuclease III [Stellaceae bacterium]
IKVRLPNLLAWLERQRPDAVCLQEIKCLTDDFPLLELKGLGYHAVAAGQKTYNGVALVTREPAKDVKVGLPGDPADTQARYIEATVGDLRIASIYLPNGNPVASEKFPYKLAWMKRLEARARELLAAETPAVLAGDYNVAPADADVYDPVAWREDALCRPESRSRFRSLINLGFTDAIRVFHAEPHCYTYWDYQAGRWMRDEGLRIDHLLLTPQAADRLTRAEIDKAERGRDKASDHTPVWCEIAPAAGR